MNNIKSIYWVMPSKLLNKHRDYYSRKYDLSIHNISTVLFRPEERNKSWTLTYCPLTTSNIDSVFWDSYHAFGIIEMTENGEFNMHSQWYFNYMMEITEIPLYLPRALCRDFMQSEAAIKDFNKELVKHEAGFFASPEVFYT